MAAGLSIDPDRIPEFRRALSRTVLEMCGETEKKAPLHIDGYLNLADLSLDLVEELERLSPFGQGNPSLTLASKNLVLKNHTPIGRTGEHLQLIVEDEQSTVQKVLWWRGVGQPLPKGRFDLAYTVRASDYRGLRDVQVEWVDARDKAPPEEKAQIPKRVQIVDYRQEANPRQVLERVRSQENIQVWSEAGAKAEVAGRDRSELDRSQVLVIWTTPAGPNELQTVLERVSPGMIYLFGIDPGLDRPEEFLKRLAGLAKHALSANQGRVGISTLAAATAQRDSTVRAGLAWLAARGYLVVHDEENDEVHLTAGSQVISADLPRFAAQLNVLLEETAAYREHFVEMGEEALMKLF